MALRKPFLLRIDATVLEAYQRWAAEELRSLNGQLEFVLRRVLKQEGRKIGATADVAEPSGDADVFNIVLEPGEEATIERDGLSLVTALSDAQFVLLSRH